MAAVLFFCDTNMANVTSCENNLYRAWYNNYGIGPHEVLLPINREKFLLAVKKKPFKCAYDGPYCPITLSY